MELDHGKRAFAHGPLIYKCDLVVHLCFLYVYIGHLLPGHPPFVGCIQHMPILNRPGLKVVHLPFTSMGMWAAMLTSFTQVAINARCPVLGGVQQGTTSLLPVRVSFSMISSLVLRVNFVVAYVVQT